MSEVKQPDKLPALPKRICSDRDGWTAYVFVVFWLIPVIIVALTNKGFPNTLLTRVGVPQKISVELLNFANNMYRVSCLFPSRISRWGNYYYLVRREGERQWISVPEEELARLKPFGYRSRLKRMLDGIGNDEAAKARRQAMAEFIKMRYEQRHPDAPRVVAVRLVRAAYLTGSAEMARPAGRWQRPPLAEVEADRLELISTHDFTDGSG